MALTNPATPSAMPAHQKGWRLVISAIDVTTKAISSSASPRS